MRNDAEAIVREGAIVTAWRTVQMCDPEDPDPEGPSLSDVQEAVAHHGPEEMARGLVLLVGSLLEVLAGSGSGEEDDNGDPVSVMLPALLRQLRAKFPDIRADTYPTLGAIIIAGLTGQDAVAWRDKQGTPELHEIGGLTAVAWLVRDYIDFCKEAGTADKLIEAIFFSTPEEADSPG